MRVGVVIVVLVAASCDGGIRTGIDAANELMFQRHYAEAERLYRSLQKRLEAEGPSEGQAREQLISVLDKLGTIYGLYLHDHEAAIKTYERIIQLTRGTDRAMAARATIADIYFHQLNDLRAAITAYQEVVTEFPQHPEAARAQLQVARAYYQLRDYPQARLEAQAVVRLRPGSQEAAQARFEVGNTFYLEGRHTDAIAIYEQLLRDGAEGSQKGLVTYELGNCYQELGEMQRALESYYESLPLHPNPMLVQRKLQKVRARVQRTAPSREILSFNGMPVREPIVHAHAQVPTPLAVEGERMEPEQPLSELPGEAVYEEGAPEANPHRVEPETRERQLVK